MTAEFTDRSMSQTFSVASPGRLARKSSMGINTTMLDEHLSARPKSREQLTPMPTYMEPITKSAGRCWAKLHEDHMLLKLRKRKALKSEQNHKIRDDAIHSVKRLPTEVLVMDWMKEHLQTLEPRVFLIENLLPTLILGLEKLLVEVEKRGVGELTTLDFRFNPINFLAQYLMRNNPRYSNFSEASPYIHGLRLISEEMKKQLFDYDTNSLSVMKIQARRRRKQREAQRSQLHAEKKRRMKALINQYEEWSEGLLTGGHIDLALIQNTLRSFFEITEQYPQELRQVTSKMAELLEPTDDTDTSLSVREYTSYMKKFIIDIPSEIFDHLLTHLSQCAREYKAKVEREHRRTKLAQLFSFCDHTGVGLVDRHRILNLFEIFYDKAEDDIRNALRNPRKWPVLEVTEVDSEDGGPDEEEQDPKFFDNNRDVTEETKESNPGNLIEISAPDEENVEEKELPKGNDPVNLGTHAVKALPASVLTSHGSRSQSQASAFDENTLNESQFVQLTETFLSDDPDYEEMFTKLVGFVKDGYMETEEERMKRLIKARQDLKSAKQKALLNSLFEMWDNDGSGVLDIEEIEATMNKYKDGMEVEAITKARKEIKKKIKVHQDSRINKREFRELVFRVISMMPGMDEFDYFVDFLLSNVERSYAERVRGEARKKWLQQIVNAAEMSAARMEPVYKVLFKALFKDAEAHGGSKVISGYIALLEKNDVAPKRGGFMLRYVASTPSDAIYLLGRALFPDMKGISFACVEAAKPIHVPKVANHGNIHFWNIDRIAEERNGSFIVIPLKDRNKRVFGILGIDTMNDPHSRALFITHEIQFFQGVAKAFSIAYHHVDVRQKTMRISESAISWIRRRSPHVIQVTVYMVEPDGRNQDFVLRKMMDTNLRGVAAPQKNPPRLERKDNLFRDYLFKCVDNSETISADAYGERHLAVPLRDYDGWAIVVVDISIIDVKELPHIESREVMKMLKLLQMAYKEIFREAIEGEKKYMLEGERESDNDRTGIMFDRLMLMELRDNVSKLDATAYAELKSYKEPPEVVHLILKSVLAIFHHKLAVEGYFDNWNQCKQYVKPQLNQMIINYDPTAVEPIKDPVPLELINSYLDEVPHGTVAKHGSMPAQFLYNWVFVCVSLIEHSRKMRAGRPRVITEEIAARKRTKVLEGMASADVEDAKEEEKEEEEKRGDDKEAESGGEGEDETATS